MRYFGWDVSSSVIGACAIDQDGNSVAFDRIILEPGELKTKYQAAERFVREFFLANTDGDDVHFIEDRLGNFTKGATTMQTLMTLAGINAVITFVIMGLCGHDPDRVVHLHPSTVKSFCGLVVPKGESKKPYVIAFARLKCPDFPYVLNRGGVNPVDGTDDMADAFALAYTGRYRRLGVDSPEKATAPPKGARKTRVRKARKV
jgi:hypothetical protein